MNIKCPIVKNAPDGTYSLITRALEGQGSEKDPNLVCGGCETILVEHLNPKVRLRFHVACFMCLAVNNLDAVDLN